MNTIENSRLLKLNSTSLLLKVIAIQAILTWLSMYVVSPSTWALQASAWKCKTCLTHSKLLVVTSWSANHKIDLSITLRLLEDLTLSWCFNRYNTSMVIYVCNNKPLKDLQWERVEDKERIYKFFSLLCDHLPFYLKNYCQRFMPKINFCLND